MDYVLVGGIALDLHGVARATEAVDLFVRPDEVNVARLRNALRRLVDDPDIDGIEAADLAGPYPVIRYTSPDGGLTVDVLARLGDRFSIDDLEAERIVLPGTTVRVATPATLWRMKRDTVRAIDAEDAGRLQAAFGLDDGGP